MPPFASIGLFLDPVPRSPFLNLALDEALLRSGPQLPLLRCYAWDRPAFSFGYSQLWDEIRPLVPGDAVSVRRWSGGGLVDHRHDLTYSLIVPRSDALSRLPILDSYRLIHQALGSALREEGHPAELAAPGAGSTRVSECFQPEGVARHDLVLHGRKIAGAAQRRHREGLLHQGSLVLPGPAPFDWSAFGPRLARALAPSSHPYQPGDALLLAARRLAAERYATDAWRERH